MLMRSRDARGGISIRTLRISRGGGYLFFSSSPYLNHGYGFTRRNDEAIGRRRRLRCPLRELWFVLISVFSVARWLFIGSVGYLNRGTGYKGTHLLKVSSRPRNFFFLFSLFFFFPWNFFDRVKQIYPGIGIFRLILYLREEFSLVGLKLVSFDNFEKRCFEEFRGIVTRNFFMIFKIFNSKCWKLWEMFIRKIKYFSYDFYEEEIKLI